MGSDRKFSAFRPGPGRYDFNAEGVVTSADANPEFFRDDFWDLLKIRERVRRSMPQACGCEHEERIATLFTKEAWDTRPRVKGSEGFEDRVLCPRERREKNPNCAHADEHLDPDPYSSVVDDLSNMGVIEPLPLEKEKASWGKAVFDLEIAISALDSTIAGRRYSLPIVGDEARELQRPHVERLLVMRSRLLQIIDTVLADISRLIPRVSDAAESPFAGIPASVAGFPAKHS